MTVAVGVAAADDDDGDHGGGGRGGGDGGCGLLQLGRYGNAPFNSPCSHIAHTNSMREDRAEDSNGAHLPIIDHLGLQRRASEVAKRFRFPLALPYLIYFQIFIN